MTKKVFIAIIGCLIVIGTVVIAFSGQKPYKDLEASDIVSATVFLAPPNKTVKITEIKDLVEYLNEVVIYNKDNSYSEYCG